ncbi:MAG: peptide/nickel transport system permease protein, partial [Mycobacterium sp.]|nr:peptide/nickel transport system permease protein [Mycobacterium sp.]
MLRYVLRRLGVSVFTLWAISVLTFIIIQLPPGDFASVYLLRLSENGAGSSAEVLARLRADFGLDQPVYLQYLKWIGRMLQGDLGISFDLNRPVADVIGGRMLLTVVVSVAAIGFTWLLALPIGVYSAVRRYTISDYFFTFVGFVGLAVPNFLLALALMYFLFSWFGWSVGGLYSPAFETAPWSAAKAIDVFKHLLVPAIVLGAGGTAN